MKVRGAFGGAIGDLKNRLAASGWREEAQSSKEELLTCWGTAFLP